MNIQEISKVNREVTVTLSADELIKICNALYHMNDKDKSDTYNQLHSELILARDLCQYGGIDNFSLSCIVDYRSQCSNIEEEIKRRKNRRDKKEEQQESK